MFGITRIRRAGLPRCSRSAATGTPAATEIRSRPRSTAPAISLSTAPMICGFTARMITSDSATRSRFEAAARIAVPVRELLEAVGAHVGGRERGRGHEAGLEQALDDGLAHVPRPEEPDLLVLDAHRVRSCPPPGWGEAPCGARAPKIAVPTRTMVAPSSIATS